MGKFRRKIQKLKKKKEIIIDEKLQYQKKNIDRNRREISRERGSEVENRKSSNMKKRQKRGLKKIRKYQFCLLKRRNVLYIYDKHLKLWVYKNRTQ